MHLNAGNSAEVVVKQALLLLGAALAMAACSEVPSAPVVHRASPATRANDLECRSGYIIAYDENGNPYCAPDPNPPGVSTSSQGMVRVP
jgi:hypothetical protein